jgi:hypothetical protein
LYIHSLLNHFLYEKPLFCPPLSSNLLKRTFIVALAFIFMKAYDAKAQFMTVYSNNQVLLSSQASTKYATLQDTNHSKSAKIVSTQDVRNVQSGGRLFFLLPGTNDTLRAEATLITDDANGFTWSGKLLNTPGYLSFVYQNGTVGGFVQAAEHFYELIPLEGNYQAWIERNNDHRSECATVDPEAPTNLPPGPDYCDYLPTYNTCPALITVLFIVTPEAETWANAHYGNVNLLMQLGQITANMAFNNSDIPNKEVRIQWIIPEDTFPFNLGFNINADLTKLQEWGEPYRSALSADAVVLLSNRSYATATGVATGDGAPAYNKAFAIVEAPYMISDYVFAHELGHLFGCRHAWKYDYGNDNEGVCAHAIHHIPVVPPVPPSGYDDVQEIHAWYTLLANSFYGNIETIIEKDGETYIVKFLSDTHILHYSNPAVSYDGFPTGRDASSSFPADNADQIRKTGCTVAEFGRNIDLTFSIRVPGCHDPLVYTADIAEPPPGFAGVGPYTVNWYWSTSGIFTLPLQLLGTGQSLSLERHPACPVYWIKCIVTSADGVVVSRIRKITLQACGCVDRDQPEIQSTVLTASDVSLVYPNPVTDGKLLVRNMEQSNSKTNYMIVDATGRTRMSGIKSRISSGLFQVDVNSLENGCFVLRLQREAGKQENIKFVIAKDN